MRLSQEVLDVLSEICYADHSAILPGRQLDRSLYESVNEVLTNLGGKWNKRAKAHQFPYDPRPLVLAVLETGELPPKNPTAFFPTPAEVVKLMLDVAHVASLPPDFRVLEPSAGTGAIAAAVRSANPELQIDVCEFLDVNRAALSAQGFQLVAKDFTQYAPDFQYEVVLMNPPFSLESDKTAYISHINHAWSLLKENGYLVAITPMGWLTNETAKQREFRRFVCDYLDFEEIGQGVFKESGTMINTILMYGCKSDSRAEGKYNGWSSYHGWNGSLHFDNDFETYTALRAARSDRARFGQLCLDAEKRLVSREFVPLSLREADIDDLFEHYGEE